MSKRIKPFDSARSRNEMVAAGYIRVSRQEQARDGLSLEAQRTRIEAYAIAKGLQLTTILADEGISGKELNRPGLSDLLNLCANGVVGHVIIARLDRLTRRTRHLLSLVEDLFIAKGVGLHSVSESLDTSTPAGRFVLTLFGALAQMERELIADRTRAVLALKRENGWPTSHPPLGFRPVGKQAAMEPVPEEIEIVRRIIVLWKEGVSFRGIARRLNSQSVKTKRGRRWYHTTIRKIVSNRARYEALLVA